MSDTQEHVMGQSEEGLALERQSSTGHTPAWLWFPGRSGWLAPPWAGLLQIP